MEPIQERKTLRLSNYLVLDIETEGLSPKTDEILEIGAIAVADSFELETMDTFSQVGYGRHRSQLSPFIQNMHGKNGLLDEIEGRIIVGQQQSESALDANFAAWLAEMGFQHGQVVLAGNSVHFDHGFLKVRMPVTAAYLHYRVKDIGQLAREFRETCAAAKVEPERLGLWPTPEMPHRGLADAQIELDEWRQIRRCNAKLVSAFKAVQAMGEASWALKSCGY